MAGPSPAPGGPSPAPFQPPSAHGQQPHQGYGGQPQHQAPQAYGQPQVQVQQHHSPAPAQLSVPSAGPRSHDPRSHDPSAFAATAPPPTADEFEAAKRGQSPAPGQAGARPSSRPGAPAGQVQGRDPEQVEPNAPRIIAGFVVSYESSETGLFWPIYQGQNFVGRKGAAPGLQVEIDHPTTSSRHAILWASAKPARVKLEDLGSTNGTFVADQALERGRKQELRDGEAVRFGGFNVIIKLV